MKTQLISAAAAALSMTLFAADVASTEAASIVNSPASRLNWETSDEGVGFAPLTGDRFIEAYMAMVRLPAGLVSPAHIKTSNMFGVVVSGTLTHLAVGADPASEIPLSEGSFYKVPAGIAHVSKCISDTDCVTFLYQDGKFDFLPIDK
jgi:quercetin dioxygenase-like cupin family protein